MTSALWRRGGLPNMTMGSCLKTLPNAGWSYEPEILWTSHVVAPDDVVLRPTSPLFLSLARPIYLKVNSVLHRQSVRPDVAPSHYRDGPRTVGIGNGGGDRIRNGTAATLHLRLRPSTLPLHTR